MTFCDWLLSLSIMFSKFTHIIACVSLLHLLLLVNIPWHGHNTVGLSIHQLIDILIIFTFWLLGIMLLRDSLVAQRVKSLPAMRKTWVRSLGREDPLEKKMATRSSILAWKIPWTEEPCGIQSMGSQRVRHDWAISLSLFTFTLIFLCGIHYPFSIYKVWT